MGWGRNSPVWVGEHSVPTPAEGCLGGGGRSHKRRWASHSCAQAWFKVARGDLALPAGCPDLQGAGQQSAGGWLGGRGPAWEPRWGWTSNMGVAWCLHCSYIAVT